MTAGNPKFILARKKNIEELENLLKMVKTVDERKKVLASFAYEKGLRLAKVREYYKILKDMGRVD